MKNFFIMYIALLALRLEAWPILFGPEFTFTNHSITWADGEAPKFPFDAVPQESYPHQLDKVAALARMIFFARQSLGETLQVGQSSYFEALTKPIRLTDVPDTFINIGTDIGVIEVRISPLSLEDNLKIADKIDRAIFAGAKDAGLRAHAAIGGGGHINIGYNGVFSNDHRLFRNFIVQEFNHPEQAHGIFEYDYLNAPPFRSLPMARKQMFRDFLERFDRGEFGFGDKANIELINFLLENVYKGEKNSSGGGGIEGEQAVNLESIRKTGISDHSKRRIELRAYRAQHSFSQYLKQILLIERRIHKLRTLTEPIPLDISDVPKSRELLAQNFEKLVRFAGLDVKNYLEFIPPKWWEFLSISGCDNLYKNVSKKALKGLPPELIR